MIATYKVIPRHWQNTLKHLNKHLLGKAASGMVRDLFEAGLSNGEAVSKKIRRRYEEGMVVVSIKIQKLGLIFIQTGGSYGAIAIKHDNAIIRMLLWSSGEKSWLY